MSDQDSVPVDVPPPSAMLHWEQQIGYLAAGIGAASGVIIATSLHDVGIGLLASAAAIALAVGVHHGHRVITALVGIPSLLLLERFFPAEVVVGAYVMFLMLRNSNAQSKARRRGVRMTAAERRAAGEAHAEAKRAKRKGTTAQGSSKTPAANRRYTPPKPKRPVSVKPATKPDEGKPAK